MTSIAENKQRLSIQLTLNGFSFLVVNVTDNKIVEAKQFTLDTEQEFLPWLKVKLAGEPLLRKTYEKTSLLFATEKYTLVPSLFYEKDRVSELFTVVHPFETNTELLKIENLADTVLIYAVNKELFTLIGDFLPQAQWTTNPSLDLQRDEYDSDVELHIQVFERMIYVAILKKGQLQFSNHFYCKTVTDRCYYILYCLHKMKISNKDSLIVLRGHELLVTELKELLNEYHPSVFTPKPTTESKTSIAMENLLLTNTL